MAQPTEAQWKRMANLVDDFYKMTKCQPFREPVPWKEMGLVDYPKIIKHPMDLGTIAKHIKAKKYPNLYAVNDDVRLVWDNCMTYNQDGSEFYKLADGLKKNWDTKYNNLLKEMGKELPPQQTKVSLQDKRTFAKLLYCISKEDLGIILVDLERMSPDSITRNEAEDELELNIDNIRGNIMAELLETLNGFAKKKKAPPKAKKAKTAPTAA